MPRSIVLALLLLLHVLVLGGSTSTSTSGSEEPLSEDVLRSVSAYVRHKLSWRPEDYPSRGYPYQYWKQCHPRDSERFTNASVRLLRKSFRTRYIVIERAINRCARPFYFPRTLSANQISWKSRPRQPHNDSTSANGTATGAHPPANGTHASGANATAAPPAPTPQDRNASNEVIHKYLVFALLLPQHPFSSELAEALRVVAPMFPDITIVIGSGYEFRDFCGQYNVRSFPKLLFFHRGMLKHKYRLRHNPWELAQQFARWTNALPVVAPDPGTPHRWIVEPQDGGLLARLGIRLESYVNRSSTYFPFSPSSASSSSSSSAATAAAVLRRLADHFVSMMTTRSFEPLAGTSAAAAGHEVHISVAAGLFVAARGVFRVYTWTQQPRRGN